MRKDMSKVVIERQRHGHSLRNRKTGLRILNYEVDRDYDDLPKRVSGSRNKHLRTAGRSEVKSFSDLLGPLRRYLRKNVGRPWDKVYSELAQHMDKRKTTGIHVFQHVEREVKQHCFTGDDGKVYYYHSYSSPGLVHGLYVHPRTGLLCRSDEKSWWQSRLAIIRSERQRQSEWRVLIKGKRHYVKLNGIWYTADIEPYRRGQSSPEEEAKLTLVDEQETNHRTITWRVFNKRQCCKKELKTAGLNSDHPK